MCVLFNVFYFLTQYNYYLLLEPGLPNVDLWVEELIWTSSTCMRSELQFLSHVG
jgi:hypothetical protein